METIKLTETEKSALEYLTKDQERINTKIASISREIFQLRQINFDDVTQPILSDDKTIITYTLKIEEIPEDSESDSKEE